MDDENKETGATPQDEPVKANGEEQAEEPKAEEEPTEAEGSNVNPTTEEETA